MIVGQKNGPTSPVLKWAAIIHIISDVTSHVINDVISHVSHAMSSALSASLVLMDAMWQTSMTFNFVTNIGFGLGLDLVAWA